MLISAIIGIASRSTMDMDATIIGFSLTIAQLKLVFESILRVQVDDGIIYTLQDIEEIRQEAEYPGCRITIIASIDNTKQTLKISANCINENPLES